MNSNVTSGASRAARWAVVAIFFVNGAGFGNWVTRIPAVQRNLGIGEGALGLALLGIAVGALLSMIATGFLISRFGSAPVTRIAALGFCAVLIPPVLAPNALLLALALALFGVFGGALDVSMNAHAVAVERGYRRPILSSFHAAFSLGGLVGAATGGVVAASGVGPVAHLSGAALLLGAVSLAAARLLLPAGVDAGEADPGPAFVRPTRAMAGLGAVAFCVLLGEGAMADWSAVYLANTLGTGPGLAAAGFAAFSLTMTIGRLFGDRLTRWLGPVLLVKLGGAVAALGLGIGLFVAQPTAALIGFASAGIGFSVVFPIAVSAAGNAPDMRPGPAIAAVSTTGYFGFLVGPPVIGFLAEAIGLGSALYVIVLLSTAVVFLAGSVGRDAK